MRKDNATLLDKGRVLARELRREGRRDDAQTVDDLLQTFAGGAARHYLTTGEVAQRVGVSRQTVVNRVRRGLLPGVRLGGRTVITPAALDRFVQLEGILNVLDAERPPATPKEATEAVRHERVRDGRGATPANKGCLDTSVLLSAERRPLLFLATNGLFTIVWSQYIADELARKMGEMGWRAPTVEALVDALKDLAEVVDYREITGGNYEEWLRDPDDHPIMATALAGQVDYLVTCNTRDFPPKRRFAGITIITPDAFIRFLGAR